MVDTIFEDKLKGLIDRVKNLEDPKNKNKKNSNIHQNDGDDDDDLVGVHDDTIVNKPTPSTPTEAAKYVLTPPSKEMTGVTPFITKLCATLCGDLYIGSSKDEFHLRTGYNLEDVGLTEKTAPTIILYNNDGMYEVTNPPYCICVVDKTTMIIGWRGSHTIMDWVRDFGFYLSSSFRFGSDIAKVVKVQGAYMSLIENFMIDNEEFILNEIKSRGITDLIFTGHSLAGGVAQVGHLWCEGSMNTEDPWKELDGKLTIRTVAFEAPMTTVYLPSSDNDDLNTRAIAFINKCGSTMSTTCYNQDVVPRMYGDMNWLLDVIDSILSEFENNPDVPFLLRPEWDLAKYGLNKLINKEMGLGESIIDPYLKVAKSFQHIGKIIYYDSADADPKVYVDDIPDNGLTLTVGQTTTTTTTPTPPQFRSMVYKKDELKTVDVIEDVYFNHMFIVMGPGLSLSFPSYFGEHLYSFLKNSPA